jgi:hypothetical protein
MTCAITCLPSNFAQFVGVQVAVNVIFVGAELQTGTTDGLTVNVILLSGLCGVRTRSFATWLHVMSEEADPEPTSAGTVIVTGLGFHVAFNCELVVIWTLA